MGSRWLINLLLGACVLIALPLPSPGASLSGILIYMSDHFGMPNSQVQTSDNPDNPHANRWRTGVSPTVDLTFGLAVYNGLPPDSLATNPVNFPDFSIEIPLAEGENDFTLVAEPGEAFEQEHEAFVLNLYFDDSINRPGLSVMFPTGGDVFGNTPVPNRWDFVYPFGFKGHDPTKPSAIYDDGSVKVSVLGVSMLSPSETAQIVPNLDRVQKYVVAPGDGKTDVIGALRLQVDPSVDPNVIGGGPTGLPVPVPRMPGSVPVPAAVPIPNQGSGGFGDSANPAYQHPSAAAQAQQRHAQEPGWASTSSGETQPTAALEDNPKAEGSPGAETPVAATPHGTRSPQAESLGTPTAKSTPAAGSTPSRKLTEAAAQEGTPTPVVPHGSAATPAKKTKKHSEP